MTIVLILSLIGIILMFYFICFKPQLRIKNFNLNTFYLPVLFISIILLIFPFFDKTEYFKTLSANSNLNPIRILILFISISFISLVLDSSGFFDYIAQKFINKYKKNQFMLFTILYILISILTIFTSNDIVILTFSPFILSFSKKGKINPIPYLVMEFVAANTYSMLLIIGNPTNIYLSSIFNLSFFEYLKFMILPTIIVGVTSYIILILLFKNQLKNKINNFCFSDDLIKDKFVLFISLIHLALATIILSISNYLNLEMYIIAFIFALSLFTITFIYSIIKKDISIIKIPITKIPFNLIFFILSMFTIISALDSYDFFSNITKLLNNNPILYLITSTISANILNNIPMTLAYSKILPNINNQKIIYATIIGSNIGAILTPVGALAGIMFTNILKNNNIEYSFKDFFKNGFKIVLILLIVLSIFFILI